MAKKQQAAEREDAPNGLTGPEWDILRVVWENQRCAAGTVQEALASTHKWAYSTVKRPWTTLSLFLRSQTATPMG